MNAANASSWHSHIHSKNLRVVYNLFSVQPQRSPRFLSLVLFLDYLRSSLQVTDRSFWFASSFFWESPPWFSPSSFSTNIHFISHTSDHHFPSTDHSYHPSLHHSFIPGLKTTCFTNTSLLSRTDSTDKDLASIF